MNGFIRIYRTMGDWRWYKNPVTKSVFFHLLLFANYTDGVYLDTEVKRGQIIITLPSLAESVGITARQARTALVHLKSTGEVTCESCNRYTLITLNNYDRYVGMCDKQSVTQMSGKSHSDVRRHTNIKEIKKNNKSFSEKQKPTYDIEKVKERNRNKRLVYEKKEH